MRSRPLVLTLALSAAFPLLSGCAHDAAHDETHDAAQDAATETAPADVELARSGTTIGTDAGGPAADAVGDDVPPTQSDALPDAESFASTESEPSAATGAATKLPGVALPADCTFEQTASGLRYAVLVPGKQEGPGCRATDTVTVHYTGYLADGTRFDGSPPGQPATFVAGQLIPGWQEALGLMSPGSKVKVVIPWDQAYGEQGYPGVIPPKADLVFDVELVAVEAGPEPLPVPDFALPADAELTTTDSGLGHKIVTAGTGATPGPTDTVTVHYAGWLDDGTLFDNSYARGEPATFPLDRVIAGWTEGLQLMQEGGTSIFVIPSALGYGERGAGGTIPPNATLVFQVELLSVDG